MDPVAVPSRGEEQLTKQIVHRATAVDLADWTANMQADS